MCERLKIQVFTEINFSDLEQAIDDGRKYVKLKSRDEPYEVDGDTYEKVLAWIAKMNAKRDELRPCPFCGAVDEVMTVADFWAGAVPAEATVANQVGCTACDIWTPPYDTEAEAVAAWNRRTDD